MQLLDASARVIQTPTVIAHIHRLVLAEPAIIRVAAQVEPDPQPWGSSALHFAARHIRSDEPLLLKVHVPTDQLWWTRHLAHAYPELLPRVYATGERIGDTQLGWVLWERVPGGLHPSGKGASSTCSSTLVCGSKSLPARWRLPPTPPGCSIRCAWRTSLRASNKGCAARLPDQPATCLVVSLPTGRGSRTYVRPKCVTATCTWRTRCAATSRPAEPHSSSITIPRACRGRVSQRSRKFLTPSHPARAVAGWLRSRRPSACGADSALRRAATSRALKRLYSDGGRSRCGGRLGRRRLRSGAPAAFGTRRMAPISRQRQRHDLKRAQGGVGCRTYSACARLRARSPTIWCAGGKCEQPKHISWGPSADPALTDAILAVVDQQLRDNTPPETRRIYERLVALGYPPVWKIQCSNPVNNLLHIDW